MGEDGFKVNGYNWDARQLYLAEVVGRAHVVLDADKKHIGEWYESLCDFFDITACVFEEDKETKKSEKTIVEEIHKELEEIEKLIYATKINGKTVNPTDKVRNKEIAYDRMRSIFRKINLKIWKKGLYVPKKRNRVYGDAINDI